MTTLTGAIIAAAGRSERMAGEDKLLRPLAGRPLLAYVLASFAATASIDALVVVSSALKSYDMNQEMVARSLGATRLRAFLLITLPQIRFSVITSALLSFLTSFDEVIIALFISGGPNATITRRMFTALRDQIDPTIASISTILIAVSCTLLVLAQVFGKSKGER